MNKQPLQVLLLAVCLVSITGFGTHALLMVHLHCCHAEMNPACPHEPQEHPRPAHDHAHCLFCQSFLGIGGKYMTPPAAVSVLDDSITFWCNFYPSHFYIQPTLPAALPRGPPNA